MTSEQLQLIYDRLDKQDEKLDHIMELAASLSAVCPQHRARLDALCATVHGNGHEGLVRKVERLETVREIGSRGFWALVSLVSAVVSGTILAAGGVLLNWIKG